MSRADRVVFFRLLPSPPAEVTVSAETPESYAEKIARPPGESYAVSAPQMKSVEADLQEQVKYRLTPGHRHVTAYREQPLSNVRPPHDLRTPSPSVRALLLKPFAPA
jgi:hypothetical protein